MNWIIGFLDPGVVSALGKMILHSLWQASIIALVLGILLKSIPEQKAHLRHELSALALFMVLVVSFCTFLLYLKEPLHYITIEATVTNDLSQGLIRKATQTQTPTAYAVLVWMAGFVILAIRLAMGYFRLYQLKLNSKAISGKPLQILRQLKRKLNIRGKVALVETGLINIPGTIGYIKPIILLPISSAIQLSPAQLEAVLAHELAHIKRADFILNIFYSIIETIFYYHPAVWWITEQMQHERESNCDDLAIETCGNKVTYLQTLFALNLKSQQSNLTMGLLGTKSSLQKRFNRQLLTPENNQKTMEKMTTVIFLLVAIVGLAFRNAESNPSAKVSPRISTEKIRIELLQDTIPKKSNSTAKIKTDIDGHRYEMLKENGEVIYFKKDGKKIDSKDYAQHKEFEQLEEMLSNVPSPPAPPAPPAPTAPPSPEAAPLPPNPPAAPAPDQIPEVPPVPEAPSTPPSPKAPPAPPAPPKVRSVQELDEMELMAQEALRQKQEVDLERADEFIQKQQIELEIAMNLMEEKQKELADISKKELTQKQDELAAVAENLIKEQEKLAQVNATQWKEHQERLNEEFNKQKAVMDRLAEELEKVSKDQSLHLQDLNLEETKRILQDEMNALQKELEDSKKNAKTIRIE